METELDKIPTNIDGHCKILAFSPTQEQFNQILVGHYRSKICKQNLDLFKITIEMKCPIMVRLNLGRLQFYSSYYNNYEECHVPQISAIHGKDLETNKEMQEHMAFTIESLQMSRNAYELDGCNTFTSKLIMPLSTYTLGVVTGNLFEWLDFCYNKGAPHLIAQYQQTCLKIIKAELPNLDMYLRAIKYDK
jgi:hypothetical protein